MKNLILIITALLIGSQAMASVTVDEFVSDFTALSAKLGKKKNVNLKARGHGKDRLYYESIEKMPADKIAQMLDAQPDMTVDEFIAEMGNIYCCYPPFPPTSGKRNTVLGLAFNTSPYMRNANITIEILKGLNDGSMPGGNRRVLDSYNNWDWLKGAR